MSCYSTETGRLIRHRHGPECPGMILDGPGAPDCPGCERCTRTHCRSCRHAHAENVCPECRATMREDMREIVRLGVLIPGAAVVASMRGEREHGLPMGGEPMVMLGPVSFLAPGDDRLGLPLVVLVTWEYRIRAELEQPTELRPTMSRAVDYLASKLGELPAGVDVGAMRREIHSARIRLEDVLHAGLRDEPGVPCIGCGRELVRECDPVSGLADSWSCSGCGRRLSVAEYRYAVGVRYLAHAVDMTAAQISSKTGHSASVIRVWGARGLIRKRGTNSEGLTLYDVADVEGRIARLVDSDCKPGESV